MPIPDHEHVRLAAAVTGRDRTTLAVEPLTADEQTRIETLVGRRESGEPLQYLEGSVQFGPIDLIVDERALIPRPETERVWEPVTVAAVCPQRGQAVG